MPLRFSNWSWTQSESTVYIDLPLRGAPAGKVDIVLTEEYLKVRTRTPVNTLKLQVGWVQDLLEPECLSEYIV